MSPNATFYLFFIGLGWPWVGELERFHNNIQIASNPTEFATENFVNRRYLITVTVRKTATEHRSHIGNHNSKLNPSHSHDRDRKKTHVTILETTIMDPTGTTTIAATITLGCFAMVGKHTKFCWVGKHVNIMTKPTNSPTQGQPNPRKKYVKSGIWATFLPTTNYFSWVGID